MTIKVDEIIISNIRNIVFNKYEEKFGKGSYFKMQAETFENMSVKEFAKYRQDQKYFLVVIYAMMELANVNQHSKTANFYFEQGNVFLDLEVKENDCNTIVQITHPDGSIHDYEFTLEQQSVMQDWLEGYMKEYMQEANDYEPDDYKRNGMRRSDFL